MMRVIAIALLLVIGLLASPAQPAQAQGSACATAVNAALSRVGYQYVWGAKGPTQFDCSGLTYWSWLQAGYNIGQGTHAQMGAGRALSCTLAQLATGACWEPGDLVFLNNAGEQHVSLYIGDGLVADAFNASTGVIVHAASNNSYYQTYFVGGRRIANCDGDGGQTFPPSDPAGGIIFEPVTFSSTRQPPVWSEIPDLIDFVSWQIPQCGAGVYPDWASAPETEWYNVSSVLEWVAYSWDVTTWKLTCWMLSLIQWFGNLIVAITNAFIFSINWLTRFFVYVWLFGSFIIIDWWNYQNEMWREFGWDIRDALHIMSGWIDAAMDIAAMILGWLADFLWVIGMVVVSALGWLGWLGGLIITIMREIWLQLVWGASGQGAPTTALIPGPLQTTYPIYCGVRGVYDGLHDSQAGWILYLLYAMAYFAWFMWLSRFLSSGKGVAQ
jgi:hypothetical protein